MELANLEEVGELTLPDKPDYWQQQVIPKPLQVFSFTPEKQSLNTSLQNWTKKYQQQIYSEMSILSFVFN